ncbi:MAG: glycerate kinase [Thermofilaceae archaeon]
MNINLVNGQDELARKIAMTLLLEGLRAVDSRRLVLEKVKLVECSLMVDNSYAVNVKEGFYVIALGKAASRMAEAIEELAGNLVKSGVATLPRGAPKTKLTRIEQIEAGHPSPDEGSIKAGMLALELARKAKEERRPLLILISGGGSALMELPVPGLSLEDLSTVTNLLLKSGATIAEVNTVRKHLSLLKGGQLAAAANPSPVLSLIISDVVGDRLDVIASGPTVPDSTTFIDARMVLERYEILDKVPPRIRELIENGISGKLRETPKPGDPCFEQVYNVLIGSNLIALRAMDIYAKRMGLNSLILTSMLQGEAKEAAKFLTAVALEVKRSSTPIPSPAVILCGGETTVIVKGEGKGGRNQEFALSAAVQIAGERGVAIAAMGSDGIDGPTEVAGAVVDGRTAERAAKLGLRPTNFLDNNNSYEFFKSVGGHIITGPTGTNVNDFYLAVIISEEYSW